LYTLSVKRPWATAVETATSVEVDVTVCVETVRVVDSVDAVTVPLVVGKRLVTVVRVVVDGAAETTVGKTPMQAHAL
jgi:hypothetical protein